MEKTEITLYNELVIHFEHRLGRKLTADEKELILWMAKKEVEKQ